ncbi:uracil-DNA glycosylase [Pseudomonas sp. PSKL.D1]|uniref:uracil-DNA glycosylase n=1 Tax=Pseudomonas sp. PSKL.D1 TaxID=3029060 RepID=UPI0023814A29|nr:uracil-DNA glycosylase [Pseudomonas sp. PSKL.D1]WDY56231.1 uracil-DNA glycosylase [Pseudomonas sp. PSKL.D1]
MTPKSFVKNLADLRLDNCFNPYSDICPVYDKQNACLLRRLLFEQLLYVASKSEVDAIWMGRDLGYKGGRRTGLALTDEVNAIAHAERWGIKAEQFTVGAMCKERTATIIWGVLQTIDAPIFLWNVFPLHPYIAGDFFSNRAHNARERKIGEEILSDLFDILKPRRIVAIGNDALKSGLKISGKASCCKVRHPSYGGHNEFVEQISSLYGLDMHDKQGALF